MSLEQRKEVEAVPDLPEETSPDEAGQTERPSNEFQDHAGSRRRPPYLEEYVSAEEAAYHLRASVKWVERFMAPRIRRFPFSRKKILYLWKDIVEWVESFAVVPNKKSVPKKSAKKSELGGRLESASSKWKF